MWDLITDLASLYCTIFTFSVCSYWLWKKLNSEKLQKDLFGYLWELYYQIIDRSSYRECNNFNKPVVISQKKLDIILDDLEPLDTTNLEIERQKDDYWWKVQKYRNS